MPQNPTTANWIFLSWVTATGFENKTSNPESVDPILFNFDEAITYPVMLFTSWMSKDCIRKYTFTVQNEIDPALSDEEFTYTINVTSKMNYKGKYYDSSPSFLPLTTALKNNETYKIEITAVRYHSSWQRNSLYAEVIDRYGIVVCSGHLLEYHHTDGSENFQSSDYEMILTVT